MALPTADIPFPGTVIGHSNPLQLPGLPDQAIPLPPAGAYVIPPGISPYSFGRSWRLRIGPSDPSGAFVLGPLAYTQLRMVFEVEKTSQSTSNKAKISVYNFNAISRGLYEKGQSLSLAVGYSLPLDIFTGNISGTVKTERKGPDLVTTFECGQGEKALTQALALAPGAGPIGQPFPPYPPGTPLATIVTALAARALIPTGVISPLLTPMVTRGSLSLTGSVKQCLDRILKGAVTPATPKGFDWSIQGGAIYVYPVGFPAVPVGVLISQATGLIGTPSNGSGGDNIMRFKSLINWRIFPGAVIIMDSKAVKGSFIVRNAKFEGDTHGSKWEVSCECAPTTIAAASTVVA